MTDTECVALLQWLLPRLHLRWRGFRRVRKQVCKRLQRRITALGLDGADAYRDYLQHHPDEFSVADYLCRVTISRFNRDRGVFEYLANQVLPILGEQAQAAGATQLSAWSAGCASGEEPFTLALTWHFVLAEQFPTLRLRILGTDIDEGLLARARRACYPRGALRELPPDWIADAFEATTAGDCLCRDIANSVDFARHDIRSGAPDGEFDLVLCRNLAFTYFDAALQCDVAATIHRSLRAGGALVLGRHEQLPAEAAGFTAWSAAHHIYRK